MANLSKITLEANEWFTSTRLWWCRAATCRFNTFNTEGAMECTLKQVEIGENGQCEGYEKRFDEEKNA